MDIVMPPHVTESNIEQIEKAIKKFSLEDLRQTVNIDLSEVESIDFFGFQYVFFFKEYLKGKSSLKDGAVLFTGKSALWTKYEAEIGLVL